MPPSKFGMGPASMKIPPPPPTAPGLAQLSGWIPTLSPVLLWPEACTDRLYDLFLNPEQGRFTFVEDAGGFEEGVPLDLPVAQATLEGLNRLDEWPHLDKSYPSDGARLKPAGKASSARTPGLSAVVDAAVRGLSISEARLALGL